MLIVTCAVIIRQRKILICQRSNTMDLPLKWEFPHSRIRLVPFTAEVLGGRLRLEEHADAKWVTVDELAQ